MKKHETQVLVTAGVIILFAVAVFLAAWVPLATADTWDYSRDWTGNGSENNLEGYGLLWILGGSAATEAELVVEYSDGSTQTVQGVKQGNGAMHFTTVGVAGAYVTAATVYWNGGDVNSPLTISHTVGDPVTTTTTTSSTTTTEGLGSLEITKSITGENPGNLTAENFYIIVRGPDSTDIYWEGYINPNPYVLPGLTPGTYTVEESGNAYPFDQPGSVSIVGSGVVVAGQTAQVTITNTGITTTTIPTIVSELTTVPTTESTTTTTESTTTTTESTTTTTGSTDTGGLTTEPTGSTTTSTTSGEATSTPVPGGIQTGGGGTAGLGTGMWALIALASTLGVGLAASAVRGRGRAK